MNKFEQLIWTLAGMVYGGTIQDAEKIYEEKTRNIR